MTRARFLAALGVCVGAYLVVALRLPLFDDVGAPAAGFAPTVIGSCLLALIGLELFGTWASSETTDSGPSAVTSRFVAELTGLAFATPLVGIGPAVFLYLLFAPRTLGRPSLVERAGVALGVTITVVLVFEVWLGVNVPAGLWSRWI